jgi:tetratricopeptide (TPR) repeat protein
MERSGRLVPCLSRLLVAGLCAGVAVTADAPAPMPSQAPEPRPLQLQLLHAEEAGTAKSAVDTKGLVDDVQALRAAVERVRAAVAASQGEHAAGHGETTEASAVEGRPVTAAPAGPRRVSVRYGERLIVQPLANGGALVTCAIEREPLDLIYTELGLLLKMPVDDTQVAVGKRAVSVTLNDVPWEQAMDRILGQAGLAWTAEGRGPVRTLVLTDRLRLGDSTRLEQLAQRALNQAAALKDPASAAEALYLMAEQQAAAKRWLEAMQLHTNLTDRFGASKDPAVRIWVMRSIKGVGDAMMAMRQYTDARVVFSNYISRSDGPDQDLPAVYLACAEAGRRAGRDGSDPLAFDQAVDVLHAMLDKFAADPHAAVEVRLARLALGELLVDAGRWREAETQLALFVKAGGDGPPPDQLAWWQAECAFNLNRYDEARELYERLYANWRAKKGEAGLGDETYRTASMRIGQCWIRLKEPQWVRALVAFLRARQDFQESPIGAEIAVSIARCYAELNRDDESVAELWKLIRDDGRDSRPGGMQIDQLFGELEAGLIAYLGPVRARVLFYIAQADYRRAQRDRRQRADAARDAMLHYERVLAENPGVELSNAARIGLARAALLAGQSKRCEDLLTALLRDPGLDPRDRAVAAQVLGGCYHDQGRLRDAIRAYGGQP